LSAVSKGLARLSRLPQRARRDLRLIGLLTNWRDALASEVSGAPLKGLRLRNGVVLDSPGTLNLAFLFHEIWVREIYAPPGYEIGPGQSVIDVGANIGVFAAYAATRAPGVRVFAYEPFPGNVEWLRRNVGASGLAEKVSVRQEAVAGERGERVLHVNPESWIVHSLVREDASASEEIAVTCVTLDDALDGNGIERCDLLKLDCEGSEYEILRGCTPAALARVGRIVGEYHDGQYGTGEELCRFLESRSFRIDRFEQMDAGCGLICAANTAPA
jgi:FkbM family methyltransferase